MTRRASHCPRANQRSGPWQSWLCARPRPRRAPCPPGSNRLLLQLPRLTKVLAVVVVGVYHLGTAGAWSRHREATEWSETVVLHPMVATNNNSHCPSVVIIGLVVPVCTAAAGACRQPPVTALVTTAHLKKSAGPSYTVRPPTRHPKHRQTTTNCHYHHRP